MVLSIERLAISLVVLVATLTPHHTTLNAQPSASKDVAKSPDKSPNRAKPSTDPNNPYLGAFVGDDMSISIAGTPEQSHGKITNPDGVFKFTGKVKDNTLSGSFEVAGGQSPFSATLNQNLLTLRIGFKSFKLKRLNLNDTSMALPILGVFGDGKRTVTVRRDTDGVHCWHRENETVTTIKGRASANEFVGTAEINSQTKTFRATLINDVLSVVFKSESYNLNRVANNTVVSETVLASNKYQAGDAITYSPDHRRVAFVSNRDGKVRPAINGIEGESFFRVAAFRFSPDSKHFAHVADINGNIHAVIDGKRGPGYAQVRMDVNHTFSPNGKRYTYDAVHDGKAQVVVDGKAGKLYDRIGSAIFSPDSQRYAHVAKKDGRWQLVIDGEARGSYDILYPNRVHFSPDSKRIAYSATTGSKEVLMLDGKAGKAYFTVYDIQFSANSKNVAFAASQGKGFFVVLNESEGPVFDRVTSLTFSPDGQHIAYRAQRDGKWMIVIDGDASATYEQVGPPQFSADGQAIAYVYLADKKWYVNTAGEDQLAYDDVAGLVFSPAGHRLTYAYRRGKEWRVVTDGVLSAPYTKILDNRIRFTPDGKHVAFRAMRNNDALIVVDGAEFKVNGTFESSAKLTVEKLIGLHTAIKRADKYIRVGMEIKD